MSCCTADYVHEVLTYSDMMKPSISSMMASTVDAVVRIKFEEEQNFNYIDHE